jgi:acetylornithine deacetylase/succinyl-diaminopimelate desuccinylase-like protein
VSSPHHLTVGAADLAARLADLDHVGADAARGVTRLAWTDADAECGRWFAAQAKDAGLQVERDAAGNRRALPRHEAPREDRLADVVEHLRANGGGDARDVEAAVGRHGLPMVFRHRDSRPCTPIDRLPVLRY